MKELEELKESLEIIRLLILRFFYTWYQSPYSSNSLGLVGLQ